MGAFSFVALVGNIAIGSSGNAILGQHWAKAARKARQATSWTPWSARAWSALAQAELGQGNQAAAAAALRKAIDRDPRSWAVVAARRRDDGPGKANRAPPGPGAEPCGACRVMLGRKDPFLNPEPLIPQVYAYVAYRIGAGPDAEDVTIETFERALRYRSSYDAKKGPRSPGCSGSRGAVPTTRWRRDGRRTPTSRTFGAATI
jgi:hypothetical protein